MKSDLLDILLAQFRKNICSVSAEKLVGGDDQDVFRTKAAAGPS